MISKGLISQILLAMLLAISAFVLDALLNGNGLVLINYRVNLSIILLLYLGFLLKSYPIRAGKLLISCLVIIIVAWALFSPITLTTMIGVYLMLIGMTRSILKYSKVMSILMDFSVCLVGMATAVTVLNMGHALFFALWCFFLVQALHVMIPGRKRPTRSERSESDRDQFNQAYRSAELALQKIVRKS